MQHDPGVSSAPPESSADAPIPASPAIDPQLVAERAAGYQLLVDSVQGYAIFMLDPRGLVTTWNAGAERINGYKPQEIIGNPVSVFYPAGVDAKAKCERELRIAEHEGRFEEEDVRVRKNGEMYWASIAISPVRDASGRLIGFAKVTRDLTEQRRSDEERLRLARAEEAERRKDEFLAIMGHELRNPLAPIAAALQLLRMRGLSGCDRELSIIERQLRHVLRLVDDLLDLSRVLRGEVRLTRRRVDARDLVTHAVEVAAPIVGSRSHQLEMELGPAELPVEVDVDRMVQVLSNLLTNAAKYTNEGGLIRVKVSALAERVQIDVEDNGVGISAELMPRIFDLFTRGAEGIDRRLGGLGIGLAVAQRFVAEHQGELSAYSAGPGSGSRFSVSLPGVAAASSALPHSVAPLPAPAHLRKRVLIVEDNEDTADMMSALLTQLGHDTRVAHEGLEALRVVDEFVPQVVFSDIGLPGMDGYELVQRLRGMPAYAGIPIVAVSGYALPADRQRALQAGFSEHFAKPLELSSLARIMENAEPSAAH